MEHRGEGVNRLRGLTRKTLVGQLQPVDRGESVGYGRGWMALHSSQLAMIPVGYADSYSRSLGNCGRDVIRDCSAAVVRRESMKILRTDVTDIPVVSLGDDVVLIGHQGNEEVLVENPGSSSDMINHEFFAQLSRVIQRSVI